MQVETAPVEALDALRGRMLPGGGFAPSAGVSEARPDATAWAVIALSLHGVEANLLAPARKSLAEVQREDGSVPIGPGPPDAFWPTPLALLAWRGREEFAEARGRAAAFLLETTGLHFEKPKTSPMGHDTALRGWPWTAGTHSWVEPTALSVMALTLEGHGKHERCLEAARLLVDRQLPGGGWNYGNTLVYGTELRPLAQATGVAASALAGRTEEASVADSLRYLEGEVERTRTPLSLSWSLLGLTAWGRRPTGAAEMIRESLGRQRPGAPYSTTNLALLLAAWHGHPARDSGRAYSR